VKLSESEAARAELRGELSGLYDENEGLIDTNEIYKIKLIQAELLVGSLNKQVLRGELH
jgi:hypothetical protein